MNRTLPVSMALLLVIVGSGWIRESCASPPRQDSATEATGRLDLVTERVVVFKDGYGLFLKNAAGTADENGHAYTDEVPDAAVLGAFWAVAENERPLRSMTAGWVETTETRTHESTCTDLRELLRTNVGRRVTLELDDKRHVDGSLVRLLELPAAEVDADAEKPVGSLREIAPHGGDFVVLDSTDAGRTVLPIASVRSVSGPELTTRIVRTTEITRRSKRLTFDLGESQANRRVSLRILYFAPGIRWIPSYRMEGDLDSSASLALQGEILNEVEDIDAAAIDLVVGVPNFRFKEVVSPFVLEATLVNALRSAAPDIMGQRMSNTFTQRAGEWHASTPHPTGGSGSMELPSQLVADRTQDFFVYGRGEVTIKKGTRSAVALWQRDVPLRHVYTMETRLLRNPRTGATRRRGQDNTDGLDASPLRLATDRVWHHLELINDGNVPWTTGPVFLLKNTLPLGQELLTYTSPGGSTRVPVTVAVDVRGSHEEREIERELGALTYDGHHYTLVRKRGTIRLTSFKNEPIDLHAGVSFGGSAETASDDGQIVIDDLHPGDWEQGSTLLNNHSRVDWRVQLDPGESRTLTYTCVYYIR